MIYKVMRTETVWVEAENPDEAYQKYVDEDWYEWADDHLSVYPDPEKEEEDNEPADIDSDIGFDPYMGCFTDDC